MKRKYDSAVSRTQTHKDRLHQLAARFESLEDQLGQLESKIETELPKLGIVVSPMGNRRKVIAAQVSTDIEIAENANSIVTNHPVKAAVVNRKTKSDRKPKPR